MTFNLILFFVLLAPIAFLITALTSRLQPGQAPILIKRLSLTASIIALVSAAFAAYAVLNYDIIESGLLGMNGLGFSLRLDAVSVLMFGMISILALVVLRFSFNYLDGDAEQGKFLGRMAATIASVQLLVLSGNLLLLLFTWVLTSNFLHRLLIFYPDRPGAIISAKKKYLVARLGDLCFTAAVVLVYLEFGTGNMSQIFIEIKTSMTEIEISSYTGAAALFLALAALLKSAQFPSHGWLIEVMETPTPVSALLHAGLLNAGPFLIIRLAPIFEATSFASLMLMFVGGFTAVFASTVFLSQSSIKTALAYSSIAHMGFSLMVCGLGVYSAAMLHLVAHSFYKAHSFLSSGSVIDRIRANKIKPAQRQIKAYRIFAGIALALLLYVGLAKLWGLSLKNNMALIAIGAILVLGLSKLFAEAFDSKGSWKMMLKASLLSIGTALCFFILESGFHTWMESQAPQTNTLTVYKMTIMAVLLVLFTSLIFLQIWSPTLRNKPAFQAAIVHLRNGLYINTFFDSLIGAQKIKAQRRSQTIGIQNIQLEKEKAESKELILEKIS